ncbi:uncharacterized protein LOC124493532 [Dermatophagoides farinae]|uniref:uncharacterized protein LOC124493532 n=1 Tax=Dermatophagoides farinae TaxID=6954 RepID=UPI003F5EAD2B
MSSFSETNLVKKLENVTSSQESIQSLSLWVIHYQKHYKKIVEQWLKCYTRDKSDHQLVLFYLANDIVQNAKKKNLSHYLSEFMNALREACKVTNDEKIMNNIHRVLSIWQDRSVYSKEFINELRELLCGEKIEADVIAKIIHDFDLNDIINQINNTVKVEQFTRAKYQNLINCKLDFANSDLLNKLKDKSYGEQCSKELDDATKCLESAKIAIEKEIVTRKSLLTALEKSKIYYDIQMKESKAIAETFNNCEVRLRQVQSMLNNYGGYTNFSSLNKPPEMNASQLSSVLNFFQQTNNQQVSSLDKRLTSLMSGTGQFPLNPGLYGPSNENFNKNSSRDVNQIESVITTRSFGNENPVENFEPADMDLGDSEDEDNRHASDSIQKSSLLPPQLSSFIGATDIGGTYCFIPPPPPPPPPSFEEFLGSSINDSISNSNDLDKFRVPQQPPPQQHHSSSITPLSLSNIIPNIPSHIGDVNNFQIGDSIQSISSSNRPNHNHHQHHHHNRNASSSSSLSSYHHHHHHNQSPSSSNNNNRYSQNNRQNYSNHNRQQNNTNNRWKNGSGIGGGAGGGIWKRY